MRRPALTLVLALALVTGVVPALAQAPAPSTVPRSGNVEHVTTVQLPGELDAEGYTGGAGEVDFDGRYAYVGQFDGRTDRGEKNHGGLHIIDTVGDPGAGIEPFDIVGSLACPGNDNYVKVLDPEVYGDGERRYVAIAHHENLCTQQQFRQVHNAFGGHAVQIVDVTNPAEPTIVSAVGHNSAHTVKPHPTRPVMFILPGGTTNGTTFDPELSPTGIVDLSDLLNPRRVTSYQHNAPGCHDLGFTPDGDFAYCAGLTEVQVWDISGDNVFAPVVVNTIANPAIQFPHNAVVSDDGKFMLVNDEAFGFHTCTGEAADLYGSLWIYDISTPDLPLLAGRISPPEHPAGQTNTGNYAGWVESWCAAHNYNFVPGTHIVVASWFAGGMTAHDITDPLAPEEIAHFQPEDGVAWSAHYYGGHVLTGDMVRGVDVLFVPELAEAEEAAREGATPADGGSAAGLGAAAPAPARLLAAAPVDRTDLLVPAVLPPRPARPERTTSGGFCVLPGRVG